MVRCSQCGEEHDIFSIQPRFGRPDGYLRIPVNEREFRTRCGDDWCRLRDPDGNEEQFFLRVTLPVEVLGENRRIHWGVWVEVSQVVYQRVMDLWESRVRPPSPRFPERWPMSSRTTHQPWDSQVRST
jgi:hypothetical protein